MVSETKRIFAQAKAHYSKAKHAARRQAALNLRELIDSPFRLSDWSKTGHEAYNGQWCAQDVIRPHDEGGWDWPELFRRFQEINTMHVVVWAEDRLSCLGIIRVSGAAVVAEFIEGDPRADCPLKGRRALIVLEAASCYAQTLPRPEIRLIPANEHLAELYRDIYGFTLERPAKGVPYYRKEV